MIGSIARPQTPSDPGSPGHIPWCVEHDCETGETLHRGREEGVLYSSADARLYPSAWDSPNGDDGLFDPRVIVHLKHRWFEETFDLDMKPEEARDFATRLLKAADALAPLEVAR